MVTPKTRGALTCRKAQSAEGSFGFLGIQQSGQGSLKFENSWSWKQRSCRAHILCIPARRLPGGSGTEFGGVEVIEYLDQNGLIALAESMVYASSENQALPSELASSTEVQGSTPESSHVMSVSIAEAEKVATFEVKELPSTPQDMVFVGATATEGSIHIEYESQETGAGLLSISESLHTENWKQVPAEAITSIPMGNVDAEFRGDYVFLPGDAQGTWNADINVVSLRWAENGVYFVISIYRGGIGPLAHLDRPRSTMILEVNMSPNDDNPEEQRKSRKKYLWFGYGSYSGTPDLGPLNPGNMRAAPNILDKLFELFGVKEKTKEEPEGKIRMA